MKDETGNRHGRLLVIKRAGSVKQGSCFYATWWCLCDCGNVVEIKGTAMRIGNTQSCGCLQKETVSNIGRKGSIPVEIGERFGRLVVIEQAESRRGLRWLCKCDCGNEVVVTGTSLRTENTRSCGCLQSERSIEANTTHGKCYSKEYKTAQARKRRHKENNLDLNWTLEMEEAIRKLFPYCVYCGSTENLQVDHVYPLSKGYGLEPGNATILCSSCNSTKHNRLPKDLPPDFKQAVISSAGAFHYSWFS